VLHRNAESLICFRHAIGRNFVPRVVISRTTNQNRMLKQLKPPFVAVLGEFFA
jgi:hypothetical protein